MQQSFMCSNGQCTRYIYPVLDKKTPAVCQKAVCLVLHLTATRPQQCAEYKVPALCLSTKEKAIASVSEVAMAD